VLQCFKVRPSSNRHRKYDFDKANKTVYLNPSSRLKPLGRHPVDPTPMKRLAALALIIANPIFAEEKPLSDIDRELLLEKLKGIQSTSDSTVKGRFGVALSAFKKARESDTAAHELYLNCIEKIRFEDEARKASEFREWKKRHKDRTDSAGFRLALRHQLNWLVLSLEAAQMEDVTSLSGQGISVLEAILRDADKLKGQEKLLSSPALSSIFADAYGVNNATAPDWPESPLRIDEIYENVVLPPLRTADSLESLRKGWLKRIEHEGLLLEKWTNEGTAGKDRKPAFDKWLVEGRKDLMWAMEIDLFQSGDQQGSALRMLEHLKKNLTHKSAPKWISQFTRLVEGGPTESEENEETK